MCGIAGLVTRGASPDSIEQSLERMRPGIATRGPDGVGKLVRPGLGLMNTRLAVIDLVSGDQPIWNEAKTVGCVFNGEIYNYQDLRAQLRSSGHSFSTTSDTEVLVHLYEEKGEQLVRHLRGMYAFAIYDAERQRVMLGRDPLGIKPLYVAPLARGVAFASTIASLMALGLERDIHPSALAEYFRFSRIGEPRTVYRAVRTLLPGHVLEVDIENNGQTERRCHALPSGHDAVDDVPRAEAVAAARRALTGAVTSHLVADVEVGAFLSGGVDSSLVVAEAQKVADHPIRTFAIAFRDRDSYFDESAYAEAVARSLGTKHETIPFTPPSLDLLRAAVTASDQPFAVSSFVPLLTLSERASQEVKVVLTGDGGDEVGAGYAWYRWMAKASRYRPPVSAGSRAAARAARALEVRASTGPALASLRKAAKFARGAFLGGAAAADAWRTELTEAEAISLLHPDLRAAVPSVASATAEAWRTDLDPVEALRRADIDVLLRDEMLPKVDRAGMAHGLEGRVPLLADEFVEAMLAVPLDEHLRDPKGKTLLRQWAREGLPGIDFDRPKHGFTVPIHTWLTGSLKEDVDRILLGSRPPELVSQDAARAVWARAQAGVLAAGSTVYAMLMAELWHASHCGES